VLVEGNTRGGIRLENPDVPIAEAPSVCLVLEKGLPMADNRRKARRFIAGLALALTVTAGLAACQSSGTKVSSTTNPPSATTAVPANGPAPTTAPPTTKAPKAGGGVSY
jgi:hypothetical protein